MMYTVLFATRITKLLTSQQIQASSPKTLLSLSFVNKSCYRATVPCLRRNFALKVSSRQKLRDDTAKLLEKNVFGDSFLTYVRCLKIWGRMPTLAEEEDALEDDFDDELFGGEAYDAEFGGVFIRDPPDGSLEEVEQAWSSLTVVIQKCKHITDLIWVSRNQLPPCLLQALDQCHPSCRLDFRTFRLRSLRDPVTNSHELGLIQSRHLHSISVKTVGIDSDGKVDYNMDAIFLVAALAPNLRHLNIVTPRAAASPQLLRAFRSGDTQRVPWKGFVPHLHTTGRGELYSLAYVGGRGLSLEHIQSWQTYVCLSQLRYLNLGNVWDPLVLGALAQSVKLTSLIRFHVCLEPGRNNQRSLIHELGSLLERLEPLEEIRLAGSLSSSIFEKAVGRHGQTLHRLAIDPYQHTYGPQIWLKAIGPDEIRKIQTDCPGLGYLKISIPYFTAASASDISLVCPDIRHLRELTLSIGRNEMGASSGQVARRIWNLIDETKTVRLSRLAIVDFEACLPLRVCLEILTSIDYCNPYENIHGGRERGRRSHDGFR